VAQVGVLVAGSAACGFSEGSALVTAEIAAGTRGKWAPKHIRQASRITPIRPSRNIRLNRLLQVDDPLGISFYGSDTTMSM
jgi:hypothetical protein